MGYYQEILFPADSLFVTIMIVLLIVQMVISFITMRRFIQDKTRRFYKFCREETKELSKAKQKEEAEIAYWSKYAFDEKEKDHI